MLSQSKKPVKYNSMDSHGTSFGAGCALETQQEEPIESQYSIENTEAFRSNRSLTYDEPQRSWIDPWEAHATNRFTGIHDAFNEYKQNFENSLKNVATSIEPTIYTKKRNAINDGADLYHKYTDDESVEPVKNRKYFGKWDGVVARCLLNIFGVIMFLRVGWIVGQCGIIQTIVIILVSAFITILTTISMSAMCTNGTISDGGAYYIISRALGPAFGGSVGILFTLGNMFAISMYLIGFAEALVADLDKYGISLTNYYINDIRIWSNIILVLTLILALIGLNIVIKAQIALFIFICITILTFLIGSIYAKEEDKLYGLDGWTNGNFKENLTSNYETYEGVEYNFWMVFAIFFPAVTGIMAGANISGDLRNPSSDIPSGTIISVSLSTVIYIIMAIVVGAVASRDELIHNTLVMADICVWDYIMYFGIYAATLSSAIASLVGAPRILMAIANDNIIAIPGIAYFAKTDKNGEPVRGYYLSFIVAFLFNCVGELNLIAPLISQSFIIVYLIINFACFIMEISHSPGWRPSFKYFNRYTGILGALLCLAVMFLLNVFYALVTSCIAFALYLFIAWKDPGVSWGGAFDSRSLFNAYLSVLNLGLNAHQSILKDKSSINWRPSFLLINLVSNHNNNNNSNKTDISDLGITHFVETLRKGHSFLFAAEICIGDFRSNLLKNIITKNECHKRRVTTKRDMMNELGYLPVRKHISSRIHFMGKRVNGFYNKIISKSYRDGVQSALQTQGIGMLKPNTIIIPMSDDNIIDNKQYVEILQDTLLSGYGIMILNDDFNNKINWNLQQYSINNNGNNNIIDIWWLVDDGGLILLIPYIMSLHFFFKKCRVRINVITDNEQESATDYEQYKIGELISKFRLPFTDKPRIIRVENNNISNVTLLQFEKYAKCKFHSTIRQNVICRWLRLSELLIQHSSNSSMIIVTLPIPNNFITPNQYMAILKIMSSQNKLPPIIMMRGSGQQTLTFKCE